MDRNNVRKVSVNNMKERLHLKTIEANLEQRRDSQIHAHDREEREMMRQLEKLRQDKMKYGLVEASSSTPSARRSSVRVASSTRRGSLPEHLLPGYAGPSGGARPQSPTRSYRRPGGASKSSLANYKSVASGIDQEDSQQSLSGRSVSKLTGSGLLMDPRTLQTPESSMASLRGTDSSSRRRRSMSSNASTTSGERFRRMSVGGASGLYSSSSAELRDGAESYSSDSRSTVSTLVGRRASGLGSSRHSVCLISPRTGNAADTRRAKASPVPGEAQRYHHMLSTEALESLHKLVKESRPPTRPAPGLNVRLPPIFGPVCSVNRRNRNKLMALQLLVNQLPSIMTQPPGPEFNPLEVLSCRYLRLSATNVETLTDMCRQAGIDPGIHPHMTPEQLEDELRNLMEPLGQAGAKTLVPSAAHKP
ncbi:C16orf78 [Branchiostoma lanceolatum]|uniref:C16orf78 protein n=1 Tax=Branchiostoma lanceolatum TaxID=7740 RepID=A0A8J9ZCK3_BRALA|nr:C16orf78 [Branchiostoma lanceolatum]